MGCALDEEKGGGRTIADKVWDLDYALQREGTGRTVSKPATTDQIIVTASTSETQRKVSKGAGRLVSRRKDNHPHLSPLPRVTHLDSKLDGPPLATYNDQGGRHTPFPPPLPKRRGRRSGLLHLYRELSLMLAVPAPHSTRLSVSAVSVPIPAIIIILSIIIINSNNNTIFTIAAVAIRNL